MLCFPKKEGLRDSVKYVFPTMQEEVNKMIIAAEKISEIKRVIIFGSAVTLNCGINSDLDIAIDAPEIIEEDSFLKLIKPIKKVLCTSNDILHYNSIKNSILLDEINRNGVVVYGK